MTLPSGDSSCIPTSLGRPRLSVVGIRNSVGASFPTGSLDFLPIVKAGKLNRRPFAFLVDFGSWLSASELEEEPIPVSGFCESEERVLGLDSSSSAEANDTELPPLGSELASCDFSVSSLAFLSLACSLGS